EADYRVEILPLRELFKLHCICITYSHIRTRGTKRFEVIQVIRVYISRPINRARHEMHGHIADSSAYLENAIAYVGPHDVRHPASKSGSPVQPVQNFPTMSILGVNSA